MQRLRIRYSLKLLLVALTLIAIFLGVWSELARTQRTGVAWVLKRRGHVGYDYERPEPDGSYPRNAKPPGPNWLRGLLGIDYFANVIFVNLNRGEINDVAPLANLPRLECLALMDQVDPEIDLSPLQTLKHLREVHLFYAGLDKETVADVLPNCRIELYGIDRR